jgi:spore coat protein U-like protein
MKKNNLKKILLITSTLLLSSANNTFAATSSGTMATSGTVTGTCSVSASTMAFNTLSQSGTSTATSGITPTCTNGTAWVVTNAGDTNYMYLGGDTELTSTSRIVMPITLTSGGAAFTAANASTGRLAGTGSGSGQLQAAAITGTAESASGKIAGAYSGTVTLTITY